MNKIQKGKAGLIMFGIILLLLTLVCVAGAVACTVNTTIGWWMIIFAVILYLLSLFGLIISITFIWTGCAMKATKGTLMEGNIPAENGTLNTTRCPNCGANVKQDDIFCPECSKPIAKTVVCKKCGAENDAGAKVCTKCGEPLK